MAHQFNSFVCCRVVETPKILDELGIKLQVEVVRSKIYDMYDIANNMECDPVSMPWVTGEWSKFASEKVKKVTNLGAQAGKKMGFLASLNCKCSFDPICGDAELSLYECKEILDFLF